MDNHHQRARSIGRHLCFEDCEHLNCCRWVFDVKQSGNGICSELYSFQKQVESTLVLAKYTRKVGGISRKNRSILVDWLVTVHTARDYSQPTLFLAVSILDRYCSSNKDVNRSSFQLYGIVSLLIATKYHEQLALKVNECVQYTNNCYTASQVLEAESQMLASINFQLTSPTSYTFAWIFLFKFDCKKDVWSLTTYILERSLYEMDLLDFPPSLVALSSILLVLVSGCLLGQEDNSNDESLKSSLHSETGYSLDESRLCMEVIMKQLTSLTYTKTNKVLEAVDRNYSKQSAEIRSLLDFINPPSLNESGTGIS